MIWSLMETEYSVAIGKGYGKMICIEDIVKALLILYPCTVFFSVLVSLACCCAMLWFDSDDFDKLSEKYGIGFYFTENKCGGKILLTLFIPVVNVIMAIFLLLFIFTDWGDDD